MDISVIIVSWNARACLQECLASLPAASATQSVETIIVDNNSSDGSVEMVEAEFPSVKLIRLNENRGFAAANNIGIRASSGRYLALVNSDVIFLDQCLDKLAGYMDAHAEIGIVGPRVLNRDLSLQFSCRRFPSLWNNFCYFTRLFKVFPNCEWLAGEHLSAFDHNSIRKVDALVGCFLVARKSAVDEFGLLDEGFFIYAEDVDWCKRSWDAGWEIVFYPGAAAIHFRGGSSSKDSVRFEFEQQRSVFRYWKKHHGCVATAVLCGFYLCNHCARLLAVLPAYALSQPPHSKAALDMKRSFRCIQGLCESVRSKV